MADADQILVEREASTGIEYEMRDPDGNLIGLCERAFDVSSRQGPVPIRHIALYTPKPQRLADFYCQVLDMKEVERTDRSSIFVSDGYLNLALYYHEKKSPSGSIISAFTSRAMKKCKPGRRRPACAAAPPGRSEYLLRSTAFMIPKATASTFRKRAGMCKATTKVQTVQMIYVVQATV